VRVRRIHEASGNVTVTGIQTQNISKDEIRVWILAGILAVRSQTMTSFLATLSGRGSGSKSWSIQRDLTASEILQAS
jgi:hypothetical protein